MTKLDIINMALGHIGGELVQSTESTGAAKTCSSYLPMLIDIVLSTHYWSFAVEHAELTALTEIKDVENVPTVVQIPFGLFTSTFKKPVDLITVIKIEDLEEGEYKFISGNRIAANSTILKINYIKKTYEYDSFSTGFCEALSLLLAYYVSTRLGSVDPSVKSDLMNKYNIYLQKAIVEDSMLDYQSVKGEYELVDE